MKLYADFYQQLPKPARSALITVFGLVLILFLRLLFPEFDFGPHINSVLTGFCIWLAAQLNEEFKK
jgi:hypothetical protein